MSMELKQIDRSNIEWTGATWNPWQGCAKVTDDCDNCYMFRDMKRYGKDPAVVRRSAPATFDKPLKWQREAEQGKRTGQAALIFTCSWSDWFIKDADPWREEAWAIIRRCPLLTFQILTKRPGRVGTHLPAFWPEIEDRCLIGTSCGHEKNIGLVRTMSCQPVKRRFLSLEPMHGPVDLAPHLEGGGIEWVIVGGESGPGARVFDCDWAHAVVKQCHAAGVAVFVKQLGSNPVDGDGPMNLKDSKGGDSLEWPLGLVYREWPKT